MPAATPLTKILACKTLPQLHTLVEGQPAAGLRSQLQTLFLERCEYKNATEWNEAVRLCEALAIVGWGKMEPVEAVRGMFFNGNPETMFLNRYDEPRFVTAIWSKRKAGVTMEPGRTRYHASPDRPKKPDQGRDYPVIECVQNLKLASQRNWIPRNPVLVRRTISNCYPKSQKLTEEIDEVLRPALDEGMRPEVYGTAVNRIVLNYCLSYSDPGVKCNYVLLDEDVRLSSQKLQARLKTMFTPAEIKENHYYLRKQYDIGPFSAERGLMFVQLHFDREFSQQSLSKQRKQFAATLIEAIHRIVPRLRAKKLSYDLDAMQHDFETIVHAWAK